MKFVDDARIVFWKSSSSLLGMAAAGFAAVAAMKDHLVLLQPMISPAKYAAVILFADSSAGIAATLAGAVPFARIIQQDKLRALTGIPVKGVPDASH